MMILGFNDADMTVQIIWQGCNFMQKFTDVEKYKQGKKVASEIALMANTPKPV